MSITLLQLRTQARQRADMENSEFISDAEFNAYINSSLAELYDLLVLRYEDYYISSLSFNVPTGSISYTIPSTVFKIAGLDRLTSDGYVNVNKFQWKNRNNKTTFDYNSNEFVSYRALGQVIQFEPSQNAPGNYRLWFIPAFTNLTSDSDVVSDLQNWHEYVIVDAAIKALNKEESDVSVLMMQKNDLKQRIIASSSNRDVGETDILLDAWSFERLE